MKSLIYLHGFASDDNAFKAEFLKNRSRDYAEIDFHVPNFNKDLADFKYKSISGMIGRLRQYILLKKINKPYFIASSLSGIVALHYSHRFAGTKGLLLLAPMTRFLRLFSEEQERFWKQNTLIKLDTSFAKDAELSYGFVEDGLKYQDWLKPPENTIIIHGRNDSTVSFQESKNYAMEFNVDLLELNASHSLADKDSLETIWEQSKILLDLN